MSKEHRTLLSLFFGSVLIVGVVALIVAQNKTDQKIVTDIDESVITSELESTND